VERRSGSAAAAEGLDGVNFGCTVYLLAGCMLGVEFIRPRPLEEEGPAIVVDLLIVRFIFEF
jgi:hypothetical protein